MTAAPHRDAVAQNQTGIPGYEQLVNVDKLVGQDNAFFIGVPLNIKDANGMLVRPVAFIY